MGVLPEGEGDVCGGRCCEFGGSVGCGGGGLVAGCGEEGVDCVGYKVCSAVDSLGLLVVGDGWVWGTYEYQSKGLCEEEEMGGEYQSFHGSYHALLERCFPRCIFDYGPERC